MNTKYSVVFWYLIVKDIMIVDVRGSLYMLVLVSKFDCWARPSPTAVGRSLLCQLPYLSSNIDSAKLQNCFFTAQRIICSTLCCKVVSTCTSSLVKLDVLTTAVAAVACLVSSNANVRQKVKVQEL